MHCFVKHYVIFNRNHHTHPLHAINAISRSDCDVTYQDSQCQCLKENNNNY
jgi:hypothetical protein